jgi:hypothetical protein
MKALVFLRLLPLLDIMHLTVDFTLVQPVILVQLQGCLLQNVLVGVLFLVFIVQVRNIVSNGACSLLTIIVFIVVASTSPMMRYCGDDALFCPAGTVSPIKVKPGFYTFDYLYDVCPPGQWRNLTMPRVNFTHLADNGYSAIPSEFPKPDCSLCPDGTYKLLPGDDFSLCLPCPAHSVSSVDRKICDCVRQYLAPTVGYFNIASGTCEAVNSFDIQSFPQEGWALNTSITRFYERVCEPGHYCIGGRRFKCPAGYFGSLYQETNVHCQGLCSNGYYCMHSSISSQSRPCGAANLICPEGSPQPVLVPAGYYSNEDVHEWFRFQQQICPTGYFCPGDGKRHRCPKSTFADKEGTISDQCQGPCDRGK